MLKKKGLIIVCLSVFILVVGTGIVAPLLTPYAKSLNDVSGLNIGLLFSGFYSVRIIAGPFIGKLADKKGAKTILKYSLILYPIIGGLYVLADTYLILIFARLVHGLASAMMLPMAMTYIGTISPEGQESKYMSIYNTIVYLANAAGPAAGSVLSSFYGYKIAFSSLLVLSLISLVIICLLPEEQLKTSEKDKSEVQKEKVIFKIKRNILALSVIQVVGAISAVFVMSFYSLFLISKNIDTSIIGIILTVDNLVVGGSQIIISKWVDSMNKKKAIIYTSLLSGILTFFLIYTRSQFAIIGLFFAMSCLSAIQLLAGSSLSTIIGREEGMGETMGIINTATSLGAVIGPMVIGVISDLFSSEYIVIFAAVCWILGAGLFGVTFKEKNQREVKNA